MIGGLLLRIGELFRVVDCGEHSEVRYADDLVGSGWQLMPRKLRITSSL